VLFLFIFLSIKYSQVVLDHSSTTNLTKFMSTCTGKHHPFVLAEMGVRTFSRRNHAAKHM